MINTDRETGAVYRQGEYTIRCEWGLQGLRALAPVSDVVIIVDVLSFSTCVEVACSAGARVYPFHWKDGRALDFAAEHGAELALQRGSGGYSLSPVSLQRLPSGAKLVLPSPNGSRLSMETGTKPTLTACLRNARASAEAAMALGETIALIPAGERWPDGSLRPALEDALGAGAVMRHLSGSLSPEARAAVNAFDNARNSIQRCLLECSSGRELCVMGYREDVVLAAQPDAGKQATRLLGAAYRAVSPSG